MTQEKDIQEAIASILPDVELIIGWGEGFDALNHEPLFMRSEKDVAGFRAGFFSVHNPALYLSEYKGKKIGIVAKGCDARSVGQLVQEGLIKREEVSIIGFPCTGVIDHHKLSKLVPENFEVASVTAIKEDAGNVTLVSPQGENTFAKKDIIAEKCIRCRFPNAHIHDVFVGEKITPVAETDDYADLKAFEQLSFEERQEFWEKEMSKCIRCYACRSACPLCVCRDHCISSSRNPAWVTQADSVKDKLFFQIIHASHLAGRCTGCGECERACPVGIPVLLLKRSLSRSVENLFAYRAGIDEGTPPLLAFTLDEPTIKERDW